MNRILALQGLSAVTIEDVEVAKSGESNHCSSATTRCSTQSSFCEGTNIVAW